MGLVTERLPAMRQQDYVEIVAALVSVAILTGFVDTLVVYQFREPLTLAAIIMFGVCGFIMTVVGRRIADRRRGYRD